jgi:TadE-like protein
MGVKLPRFRRGRAKSIGQSLVEFTVLLPVLLIMISGLIEFGIMLNYYLDLIDAAREAARFAADADPIRDPNPPYGYLDPNPAFYTNVQTLAMESLRAASDNRIDWPKMQVMYGATWCDHVNGDIVISAFGTLNQSPNPAIVDKRFPQIMGENGVSMCNHYTSKITSADIKARLDAGAPTGGLVMVEIFYDYDEVLKLPWITAFVPSPIHLHAYTIMPNANVEPTPTP